MRALLVRDLRLALRAGAALVWGLRFPDCRRAGAVQRGTTARAAGPDRGRRPVAGGPAGLPLSLDRILALDFEDGTLDVLATAPLPLEAALSVKALAHWLTTGVPLVVAAPVLAVLLNLPAAGYGGLVLSLLLGTPALSVIGTFGAALTVGIKRGGLLLSLLVLPLYVPTLIFGAEAARRSADGLDATTPLLMLAGISAGVLALMPFASAAVLRVNLR